MIKTPTYYAMINKTFKTPLRSLRLLHVANNFTGVTWYGFDISTTDKVMLKFYKASECELVEETAKNQTQPAKRDTTMREYVPCEHDKHSGGRSMWCTCVGCENYTPF